MAHAIGQPPEPNWLGLDVGGANIKAAHTSGMALSVPFEVWKHPEGLAEAIARTAATLPPAGRVALTMTAELCDCFPTKAIGVHAILDAVVRALPGREVLVWCLDREFRPVDAVREQPLMAAAANWLALAEVCALMGRERRGLLIDVGSTTTDIIPLDRGEPVPVGRTDSERLRSGELVYAGVRRTPLCALATELPHRGRPTGLAAELFATTLDVYLTLGAIPPDLADFSTADGRPATPDAARDRLARMVGADRDGFSAEDARRLATEADRCLLKRLALAARRVCDETIGLPEFAIVAGSGEFLARRIAGEVIAPGGQIISLREVWGDDRSDAACAYALALLASARGDLGPGQRSHETPGVPPPPVGQQFLIKVGGSLLDWPELLERLSGFLKNVLGPKDLAVFVVGGGPLVDAIRELDRAQGLGEETSHVLAIRALDLTAELLGSLMAESTVVSGLEGIRECWSRGTIPVLAPSRLLLEEQASELPALPASWDVTSDSIAAWLARRVGVDRLILLKSADIPVGSGRVQVAAMGLVDPAFVEVARPLKRVDARNLRNERGSLTELVADE